ncbi:MAG TPA: glucuronate isomerase, partial [Alteromonas sp.]|nr:glucuronate isomerase [Alteromonas sp.]
MKPILLHEDRLFPADEATRSVARSLYQTVKDLPIISPHGHTDPRWFAYDENFGNATELFILPDHYVFRMLYSQGVSLENLGIRRWDGGPTEGDPQKIWQIFADHYYLFAGTPSRMWLDTVFKNVFGLTDMLCSENAME